MATPNTIAADDGKFVTMSSVSLTGGIAGTGGSGASLWASIGSFSAGLFSQGFQITGSGNAIQNLDGTALKPSYTFTSEQSLGVYRSAASTLAVSYGKFDLRSAGLIFSSGTTNQSASTAKVTDGQLIPSIRSLTTNGAALYFRSGNSTYVFVSSDVIG